MKQFTARDVVTVRCWLETNPHHNAASTGEDADGRPTHMELNNYHTKMRVPSELWRQCFVKPGGEFDNRMYRWDHAAELRAHRGEPEPQKDAILTAYNFNVVQTTDGELGKLVEIVCREEVYANAITRAHQLSKDNPGRAYTVELEPRAPYYVSPNEAI